jgi:hypothetical protein
MTLIAPASARGRHKRSEIPALLGPSSDRFSGQDG